MRRVSEGPLLGESQLREALMHLLNGPAAVDYKKRHSRSPETRLRTTFKNIDLRHSCKPIAVTLENQIIRDAEASVLVEFLRERGRR